MQPGIGDLIICRDVFGMIVNVNDDYYKVLMEDGEERSLLKGKNVTLVTSAYALSAIFYKVLQKRGVI